MNELYIVEVKKGLSNHPDPCSRDIRMFRSAKRCVAVSGRAFFHSVSPHLLAGEDPPRCPGTCKALPSSPIPILPSCLLFRLCPKRSTEVFGGRKRARRRVDAKHDPPHGVDDSSGRITGHFANSKSLTQGSVPQNESSLGMFPPSSSSRRSERNIST